MSLVLAREHMLVFKFVYNSMIVQAAAPLFGVLRVTRIVSEYDDVSSFYFCSANSRGKFCFLAAGH